MSDNQEKMNSSAAESLLVPREPTDAMMNHGLYIARELRPSELKATWSAMLETCEKYGPKAEPIAWECKPGLGIKRFISERQYKAIDGKLHRFYSPFRCVQCRSLDESFLTLLTDLKAGLSVAKLGTNRDGVQHQKLQKLEKMIEDWIGTASDDHAVGRAAE